MGEKVRVEITGEQVVRYHQIVEIEKTEFEELHAALNSFDRKESRRTEQIIGGCWINTRDVCDADDFEIDVFRLAEPESPNARDNPPQQMAI